MTGLWLHRSEVKQLRVKADSLGWRSALTSPFVPKYQPSTCDILALAHCSLIGAPGKMKPSERRKCQASRAALQPNSALPCSSPYTLSPLRLFLLVSSSQFGKFITSTGEKSERERIKGEERGKRRRRSQARTFIFRNTFNEYLGVQSNYRLVGKYGPTELQKLHIIDPVL